MLIHKLLPLFALGLNLLLLGSALAPDRKTRRDIAFAYLATGLAIWNLGVLGLRWTSQPAAATTWELFLHLGVIPIPVLFYRYVLVFLDLPTERASLIAGALLCGLFLAVSPTRAFMTGVAETPWGFTPAAGPLYAPFVVYVQGYLVLGLVHLLRAYRRLASSAKRNRTLLVIVGVVVSLAGGAVDFLRFILGWDWLYPVGIPSNAIFALALGVAIVRYQLMDVGLLAKRLLLYLLTSVALAPILFLGLYALDQILVIPSGTSAPAAAIEPLARNALLLLLVFTGALPLLRKLEAGLGRLMFQRQHGVRDALVALSRGLPGLLDPDLLGHTLTEGLVARIPVTHASLHRKAAATGRFVELSSAASPMADTSVTVTIDPVVALWCRMTGKTLVVEDTGPQATLLQGEAATQLRAAVARLERDRIALLVPVLLEGELAAMLVVGEKLSGEIFLGDEIELLETLVSQTAIALKNASLYADLRTQMDELRRTQGQLVQSAKLAAIGEMAASVAHEINNPLMVILGYSGLLRRELEADPPALDKLAMIEAQTNRAGKILRDLLDFARRREPAPEPLDIQEVLARALDLADSKLTTHRVAVENVYDPAAPRILGDRDQLLQVFINLLMNAADAMPDGGHLRVCTELRGDDAGRCLAVSLRDTGVGMAEEQLSHIFEPFYTTKPEGQGTGLGLSVSLGIITRYGGTIGAESAPGRGTTITVNLPVPMAQGASDPTIARG